MGRDDILFLQKSDNCLCGLILAHFHSLLVRILVVSSVSTNIQGRFAWDHLASINEAIISDCEDWWKHILKDQEVSHPLGNYKVSL